MDSLSNFNPFPDYTSSQNSSASQQPTGSTPIGDKSGSTSTGDTQKATVAPDVATSDTNTDVPLQATNQQPGAAQTVGQNINSSLAQSLGANQGFTDSLDSNSIENDDTQGSISEDAPQVTDTGLRTDQQVSAKQGFKGDGGSDKGSDHQSGGDERVASRGTAVAGSKSIKADTTHSASRATASSELKSIKTDTTHSKSSLGLSFSLKVDPSVVSTAKSDVEAKQTSSAVDTNGAPAITPAPNVFAMVEECTDLSTNLQEYTTASMIAANQGMNNTLSSEYANQITSIQNEINTQNNSNNKNSALNTFSWIVNVSMIVVGALTFDPMLVAAGVVGCLITADPKITAGLTSALEKMGIPPTAANIMATLIIVAAASVGSMGVGGALEAAGSAVSIASKAAIDASETAAESAMEDAESVSMSTSSKTMTTSKALRTPEGYSAFTESLQNSAMSGARSVAKSIKDAPANAVKVVQAAPKAVYDGATSATKAVYDAGASAVKTISELPEAAQTQIVAFAKLASKISTELKSRGLEYITSSAGMMTRDAVEQLKSLLVNLSTLDPARVTHITADLALAALNGTAAVMQYDATKLEGIALQAQAAVLASQAATTDISEQIQLSNSQIQMVLGDMNASIISAAQVLSTMGDLSAETLGQLHGA